jgi:A/G-specific adenine glycosylase
MNSFAKRLLNWHDKAGRHDLPWQQHRTPYRIWVSEIMLQQTQVNTVIPYYRRFMQRFTGLPELAGAGLDEVLHIWTGLGYYSRARNLHRTAGIIMDRYQGSFPSALEPLLALPGIGRSTAGAILALAMDQSHPILDGNVKRVLCRYYAITGWSGKGEVERRLWELADMLTPAERVAGYTQAIMDLGAVVCTRRQPLCSSCPVAGDCKAYRQGLQDELPAARPGKKLPLRQISFVMIENAAGRVLLQKRPPAGIWGGLWSFPECAVDTDIAAYIREKYGLVVTGEEAAAAIRHTFSHFYLEIKPVKTRLSTVQNVIQDTADLYWYTPKGNNKRIGLASPVKKLLENYFE